jgi:hypothetical protein
VYSETIGPFTNDTDMGVIDIPVSADYWVTVTGTVENCDGQPVTNGYVILATSNAVSGASAPIVNGSFSAQLTTCSSDEVTAYAIDLDALYSSDPVTVSLDYPTDIGLISACDNQFIPGATLYIDGNELFWEDVVISGATTSSDYYEIQITHDQGDGNKVLYIFNFLDWNSNPDSPLWGFAYTTTLFGPDPVVYNFGGTIGTSFIQNGTQVGELVEILIDPYT